MSECDPIAPVAHRLRMAEASGQSEYECEGRTFVVYPEVFPPTHFQSTGVFTRSLEYLTDRSFLEIGCGAGVTAVTAALRGCAPVVASDISAEAVANTRDNVRRHGMDERVSVRHGDLFDVLAEGERFDTIFWNSNFVYVPDDYVFARDMHRAFADPGYAAHDRFLAEAPRHLAKDGRLLLGFSGQGDHGALRALLEKHGYEASLLTSEWGTGPQAHRYDIVRLWPLAS